MSTTRKGRCASRVMLVVLAVGILSGGVVVPAGAIEVEWLGQTIDWNTPANWSPEGVPDSDDVITVPASPEYGEFPTIDGLVFYCRGLILEDGAQITVSNYGVLYIENSDGDAVGWDSDGDGMSDECESSYSFLDPYDDPHDENDLGDPDNDFDGDGANNMKECKAGTNLEDPDDYPAPVPAAHLAGILVLFVVISFAAVLVVPRKRSWVYRVIILFLIAACVLYLGYWRLGIVAGDPVYPPGMPKMSDATTVDFDINNSNAYPFIIPIAVEQTNSDGTVTVNGASVRPWNGGTTYIDGDGKTINVAADGGTVYLGGMRTTFDVALHGEGSVRAISSYSEDDHYAKVDSTISIGTGGVSCFLGEKFDLYATPEEKFVEWSGDASGGGSNTEFQAEAHGMTVEAVFLSPGIDLEGKWNSTSNPDTYVKAGDTISVVLNVRNIGQEGLNDSGWKNGLFLSRDTVYDTVTDLQLVSPVSGIPPLASLGEYPVTFSDVLIPDVAPGVYYILGVTDENDLVNEVDDDNNTAAVEVIVLDANLAQ